MSSVALIPNPEPARPVDWDRELQGAKMLLKSGLLPTSIKAPETALFIILAGRDLGLSPVQSLRSINVIQGKVEVAADMQLGLFHRAGGKSQWVELTNEKAVLRLSAPWLIQPHTETFTLEDAKRAKLMGDNWQKWPKAMCRSRAITAGLKSVGFDPTAGVYDYGEIGGPEPTLTVESTAEVAEQEVDDAAIDQKKDEEAVALAELEELMPGLAVNQQDWARTKLADGADPVAVLEKIKTAAKK
jgi:hypothetical protein